MQILRKNCANPPLAAVCAAVLLCTTGALNARADNVDRIEKEIQSLKAAAQERADTQGQLEQRAETAESAARDAEKQAREATGQASKAKEELDRVQRQYLDLAEHATADAAMIAELRGKLRDAEKRANESSRAQESLDRELARLKNDLLNTAEGSTAWGIESAHLRAALTEAEAEAKARGDENLELKRMVGGLKNRLAKAGVTPEEIAAAEASVHAMTESLRDDLTKSEESRAELVKRWRKESDDLKRSIQSERDTWTLLQQSLEEQIAALEKQVRDLKNKK